MNGNVNIKVIDEDCIEILGIKYYSERYFGIMMKREFHRGLEVGKTTIEVSNIGEPRIK